MPLTHGGIYSRYNPWWLGNGILKSIWEKIGVLLRLDLELSVLGAWKHFLDSAKSLKYVPVLWVVDLWREYCGNPNWEMKVGVCLGTGKVCKAREKGN